ncbi:MULTISPECIES: AMP-binding protein [unclassified Thermosynechococcus]|uniref:AMP-binding protein n=1 Tax=unclassified Thermosynechococcus TaxID=2622553 RepID=UPI001A0BDDD5|nr:MULTISPECIES: AMP-binding protein [unclassified Thermosynechococcus]HIK35930.1 AMP-binding protein [Thermosynechococcus sp. M98_K2018_005]HIK48330.1 AMP-binding protein [Thermosynechococcus sp. M55_K2018_012]
MLQKLTSIAPHWLSYPHNGQWRTVTARLLEQLANYQEQLQEQQPTLLVLAESDPLCFIRGFLAALSTGTPLLLANPHWQSQEWQQVAAILPQNFMAWGSVPPLDPQGSGEPLPQGWILIPTGGTQGRLRWAIHTVATLQAAVMGLQSHLQEGVIHCLSILPLYHVSGLMPVVRSLWTGGELYLASHLRDLRQAAPPGNCDLWLSLVPRQLQQVLTEPLPWLGELRGIFIGGGPTWSQLLEEAAAQRLPLCLSYGMTETAGMICAQRQGEFWTGDRSCGQVLPHAQIALTPTGEIQIQAASLALGYYPQLFHEETFQTDDRAQWRGDRLYILGRTSRKIISGGENIYPEELEALLLDSGLVQDIYIYGTPDPRWGEQVVALYVGEASPEELSRWLKQQCSAYKCPKQWISVPQIPRTPQGKVRSSSMMKAL